MDAKDYNGTKLSVGDSVIAYELNYRNFLNAVIIKITGQTVLLEATSGGGYTKTFRQRHNQVISIQKLEATNEALEKRVERVVSENNKLLTFANTIFLIAEECDECSFEPTGKALEEFTQDDLYREVKEIPFEWEREHDKH